MAEVYKLIVPRIGEGAHQVRIQRLLKAVGDNVLEDENLAEVETDKAVLEISAPISGTITKIFFRQGETAKVGEVFVHIDPNAAPVISGNQFGQQRKGNRLTSKPPAPPDRENIIQLHKRQYALIRQMRLSREKIILAQIEVQLPWALIESIKKGHGPTTDFNTRPSSLEIILWHLSLIMGEFKKFRARLLEDGTLHVDPRCLIGVARANEEDSLSTPVLAVSSDADLPVIQSALNSALQQADETHQNYHSITVSDMTSLDVIRGQPIVISPAVATLFIGTPHYCLDNKGNPTRFSNLVLAFDHQIINGAYAAKFLKALKASIRRHAGQSVETKQSNVE